MNVDLHPRRLNCISLCSGGGGLDLGVELAIPGARVVAMVEREAFAVAHLVEAMQQGLLAPAPIHTDVRTFPGRRFRGCVDGLFGGIPCQPHSEAGLRLGQDDERDLWSPTRRILVQSGAWFVLIENVAGMLSSGGAERVRRDLHRLGYSVEGGLFKARQVGASHERARLFILGVADAKCDRWRQGAQLLQPGALEPELAICREDLADDRALVDTVGGGRDGRSDEPVGGPQGRAAPERAGEVGIFPPGPGDRHAWRAVLQRAPHLEPAVRRVADGLADRVDRLRMLGNGVVPLQAAYAIRTLATRLAARSAGAADLVRLMGD